MFRFPRKHISPQQSHKCAPRVPLGKWEEETQQSGCSPSLTNTVVKTPCRKQGGKAMKTVLQLVSPRHEEVLGRLKSSVLVYFSEYLLIILKTIFFLQC